MLLIGLGVLGGLWLARLRPCCLLRSFRFCAAVTTLVEPLSPAPLVVALWARIAPVLPHSPMLWLHRLRGSRCHLAFKAAVQMRDVALLARRPCRSLPVVHWWLDAHARSQHWLPWTTPGLGVAAPVPCPRLWPGLHDHSQWTSLPALAMQAALGPSARWAWAHPPHGCFFLLHCASHAWAPVGSPGHYARLH